MGTLKKLIGVGVVTGVVLYAYLRSLGGKVDRGLLEGTVDRDILEGTKESPQLV